MFNFFIDFVGAKAYETTIGKTIARITTKILSFWILSMGGCYGFMIGSTVGLVATGIFNVKSDLLIYLSAALFAFVGLLVAYFPARFFHSVMYKLGRLQ